MRAQRVPPLQFPLRVLVTEANALARKGIVDALEALKNINSCVEADSCAQALKKCKSLRPHVVVLSSKLPAMEALAAVQQMKSMTPKMLVLLMASADTQPLAQELTRIGADSYVGSRALLLGAIESAQQSELLFFDEPEPDRLN